MTLFQFKTSAAAISAALMLSACGSSGGGSSTLQINNNAQAVAQAQQAVTQAQTAQQTAQTEATNKENTAQTKQNEATAEAYVNPVNAVKLETVAAQAKLEAVQAKQMLAQKTLELAQKKAELAKLNNNGTVPTAEQQAVTDAQTALNAANGEQTAAKTAADAAKTYETKVESAKTEALKNVRADLKDEVTKIFLDAPTDNGVKKQPLVKSWMVEDLSLSAQQVENMDYYLNGQKYTDAGVEIALVKEGFHKRTNEYYAAGEKDRNYHGQTELIYKQPYSQVAGYLGKKTIKNGVVESDDTFDVLYGDVRGLATKDNALPTAGVFNYRGAAFSKSATNDADGVLNYAIDFDQRKGSGSITGIAATGAVALKEANIVKHQSDHVGDVWGVKDGVAELGNGERGIYHLGIFGPNADEVAGVVNVNGQPVHDHNIGFGGKKQ